MRRQNQVLIIPIVEKFDLLNDHLQLLNVKAARLIQAALLSFSFLIPVILTGKL